MGDDVTLPEPLNWFKIFIDNQLNGNLILNVSA